MAWVGLLQLPPIAPVSNSLPALALLVPKATFGALLVLVVMHVGVALDHHWRLDDDAPRRMLRFTPRGRRRTDFSCLRGCLPMRGPGP